MLPSIQFSPSEELNFTRFSALTNSDYSSLLCNLGSTKPILNSFQQSRPTFSCACIQLNACIQFNAQFAWDLRRTKLSRNKILFPLPPFLSLVLFIHFYHHYRQRNYIKTFLQTRYINSPDHFLGSEWQTPFGSDVTILKCSQTGELVFQRERCFLILFI
jgi:hypothetical protein